jgi:hypothetical protein
MRGKEGLEYPIDRDALSIRSFPSGPTQIDEDDLDLDLSNQQDMFGETTVLLLVL